MITVPVDASTSSADCQSENTVNIVKLNTLEIHKFRGLLDIIYNLLMTMCHYQNSSTRPSPAPPIFYCDVIMSTMASQITCLAIVYSSIYSGADQRKHQSSASLAFVRGIHRWPVNSPHKGPVTRKCFHLMTSSCKWLTHRGPVTGSCQAPSHYLKQCWHCQFVKYTYFVSILFQIHKFSSKKIHFNMSSAKYQWFCIDLEYWYYRYLPRSCNQDSPIKTIKR